MELTSNSVIAIVVSLTVGVSAAVPLAFMQDVNEPFPGPQSNGITKVKVRVTILELEEIGNLDVRDDPDFYFKGSIDGNRSDNEHDNDFWEDKAIIYPGWTFSSKDWINITQQPTSQVDIAIWDEDRIVDDRHADIKPTHGMDLHFTIDLTSCSVSGDISGGCEDDWDLTGGDDDPDDAVRIRFKIEVLSSELRVIVTIMSVEEKGNLDEGSGPEFYAAVSIDLTVLDNLAGNNPWEGEEDIRPDWPFEKLVNASKTSVRITISIWDEDDVTKDDHADAKYGPGLDVVLTVTLDPCFVSGDSTGSCALAFGQNGVDGEGDEDDDVRIEFKIQVAEPTQASETNVICYHRQIWPQPGEDVEILAIALDSQMNLKWVDTIEIWVDDENSPVLSGTNRMTLLFDIIDVAGPTFKYRCRVKDEGEKVSSGWRVVHVGDPPDSAAIPVLYTGPRPGSLDIVFIADKDDYTGPEDPVFIANVTQVIRNGYYTEEVFLRNQDKLNFWIADRTGNAWRSDKWRYEEPDNWDEDYSFADVGVILHTEDFRDATRMSKSIFTTWAYNVRIALHESGHMPFGLADEYDPDGGYWESDEYPNIYEDNDTCIADARNFNRTADHCRRFVDEDGDDWFTSDPPSNDLMVDRGTPQAADIRRIDWLFWRCRSANCIEPEDPSSQPILPTTTTGSPSASPNAGADPIPVLDFDDPSKSIVVRLDFNNQTDVDFDSAIVSLQSAPAHIANPAHIRLKLFDDTGRFVGRMHAWNPLWVLAEKTEGTQGRTILESGTSRFVIPFHDDYGIMKVIDVPMNQELIEVDLKPVIREFCWQNPTDQDCMANFTWSAPVEEGGTVQFTDLSVGPGADIVDWRWDFGDGTPRSTLQDPTHVYGDNGIFTVTLRVRNSDGLKDTVKYDIMVGNVDPSIDPDINAYAKADITLRIAGEKWHDVSLTLTEDSVSVNSVSLTRYPGSPDDQAVTVASQNLNVLGGPTLGAVVEYTPDDDPVNGQPNGANPVWIILTMENGYEVEIQHTFNVNHPGTYLWTIDDILDYVSLVKVPLYFSATATDPGSDDLEFRWEWDDGTPDDVATYLNDPRAGPDPLPSPEINPRDVTDHQVHTFVNPGTYMVALTVEDDDGGVGTASLTIVIA